MGKAWMWQLRTDSFWNFFTRSNKSRGTSRWALTLTVEAACDMVISNDAVITHELTVKFREDGSFQYLGNKVLEDGIHQIPQYQYRIAR